MSMAEREVAGYKKLRCASLCWLSGAVFALHFGASNATTYQIDPRETASSFEVLMLGFIPIRGHFKHTTGVLNFDSSNQMGTIEVVVDTTSLTANSARAEVAARGPNFFNVEKYPRMDFKSSRFVFDGNRLHSIEGMLTLTGAAQAVTLAVNHAACKAAVQREPPVCRAEAALTVKRSAFGMKAWAHSVSDDVTIRIALVAYAEAESIMPTSLVTLPVDAVEAAKR